jgi:hypothetical protein
LFGKTGVAPGGLVVGFHGVYLGEGDVGIGERGIQVYGF